MNPLPFGAVCRLFRCDVILRLIETTRRRPIQLARQLGLNEISRSRQHFSSSCQHLSHMTTMKAKRNLLEGAITKMTLEEYDEYVNDNLCTQCYLQDFGRFDFVFNGLPETSTCQQEVFLYYYDQKLKQRHASNKAVFWAPWTTTLDSVSVAIDINQFLIYNRTTGSKNHLISYDGWVTFKSISLDANIWILLASQSSIFDVPTCTSVQRKGLACLRQSGNGDFCIKSEDGHTINVLKAVMEANWPFFKAMVESGMREIKKNQLELPLPHSTVEMMVRYLYGQELELQVKEATRLVEAAQMYLLPELLEISLKFIESEDTDIGQTIQVWKMGKKTGNLRMVFWAMVRIKELKVDIDVLYDLDKEDLISLFQMMALGTDPKK
ncbi:hypothetical protein B0I75DRAFT_168187 [Yarrowia lipolytica]|uniref:BTB domain-containing protein n=1 Tax=Yarrowia lipolytica TaxID=4952 RepID=A0A1D8N3J0_YARLL|nr:hypothetical protein YALI1_A03567g [Yarrowia lipolytica]KAB8284224.1 hypothetical protein BKA91DRAFT_161596 [Yarrowia lipolytica]KAE8173137.1 hypothetical protein BKA90DRAFT_156897 [Yarrowia lipolytica]KAJ8051330.1 hypothetical protein LXG23DRAFT_26307 [Yarrowia lipolytica]RDW44757.1 hypothetical protein B0I74DRAFT_164474 [Yarrowia lipolytica]